MTDSSLPSALKRLPSNYLHKKLLRNVFVWKGLEWHSLKKNWHEELCILQNKMCCFLICFYNPNKFVSHTPRLEKGAVRQFRIAVCSQLRQRICCKAVAANKCRFPAVLQLRQHSGHRAAACMAATAPGTAAGRWGRRAAAPSHGKNSSHTYLRHPPADKDTVALHTALCSQHKAQRGHRSVPPVLPTAPSAACHGTAEAARCCPCHGSEDTNPRLISPSPPPAFPSRRPGLTPHQQKSREESQQMILLVGLF